MKVKRAKAPRIGDERRARIRSLCFLAPSILGVLVFFLAPFCVVVFYAFVDNPINREFVGFENFRVILKNATGNCVVCAVNFHNCSSVFICSVMCKTAF